ncbi:MAG: polysaccharide biosynthesis/export family protein, partial [Deltaproteobacteria bacterium]|nr:polysaccharide biosynthesis/export family protein [Deltaproteobacteria bacterium]
MRLLPRHLCPRSGEELINVPVLWSAFLLALLLALPAHVPADAAEPFGEGAATTLSPGITPEQAEAARQMLKSDPEARKALDDALQKKGEADGEAAKRDPAAGRFEPEGAAAKTARIGTVPRYDWTRSTYVGGLFGKRLTSSERESLVHFGHDLFDPSAGMMQPLESMPVSKGYVVGPGDEIVVRLWGRVEGTQRVTVDRDGKIYLPKYGSL